VTRDGGTIRVPLDPPDRECNEALATDRVLNAYTYHCDILSARLEFRDIQLEGMFADADPLEIVGNGERNFVIC
jgi:hypothetical protein